ncbi:gustatory receptor for sugar taste 64a-like [Uranotaenia lowii]|uniref:gustatory receptor for sugar taste 64a-like n=1 Tax=Uranotaenia lowii TaxID=190385 RepID=UPI00247AF0C2|nr:gustatory receptor for sugar taste 64a-like [Uranotaenia lowii]
MTVDSSFLPLKKTKEILVQESEGFPSDVPNGCTSHKALAPIILFGQIFSLMPVGGYFEENPEEIKFRFISPRFLYSCMTLFIFVSIIVLCLLNLADRGSLSLSDVATIIYYTVILLAMLEFFVLAYNWRSIMTHWTREERPFLYYPYETGRGLPLESLVRRVAAVVIVFAFIEDVMNFISAFKLNETHMKSCPHASDFWRNFFRREHRYIVRVIPYHKVLGIAIELMMRVAKFTWHFIDVFIICVCLTLQRRFQQYNNRIENMNGKELPQSTWKELRYDFLRLSELIAFLDGKFSRLILMACANNMFFISMQLYNIFDVKPTAFTTIYFWYSLMFLICRCFCALYITSAIYEASLKPLILLRDFPTAGWNLDLQRLIDHVALKSIAFSGKRFFFVTRPLILAMAGTIVTYELVLLDQVEKDQDTTLDCNF